MANSKVNFICKYERERHEKIPTNVCTAKWLPQQAILGKTCKLCNDKDLVFVKLFDPWFTIGHSKIKAFFTHGGLLGIQEAVWHGVPLLAMPVFAEQDYKALLCKASSENPTGNHARPKYGNVASA